MSRTFLPASMQRVISALLRKPQALPTEAFASSTEALRPRASSSSRSSRAASCAVSSRGDSAWRSS